MPASSPRAVLARIPAILRARPVECEDPWAAPGAGQHDHPARFFTFRRAVQNMFFIYAFGLIFLLLALFSVTDGNPPQWLVVVRVALICLIGLLYLATCWVVDLAPAARIAFLVGYVALLVGSTAAWGGAVIGYGAYVSIMIVALIPWRWSRFVLVGWNLALLASGLITHELTALFIAIVGVAVGLATGGGMEAGRIGAALNRAEQRVSTLAVAAERERIARDLHDILGHSLTAVSIKAGLAARLAERDPAAAREQMLAVEQIAREALADVRATATRMREMRVAGEIASARSVLEAAGISADTPSALPPLAPAHNELFGYVVREAVTNVVRHSEAGHCTIRVEGDDGGARVSVADDGTGRVRPDHGSGLDGLRTRLAAVGGSLDVRSEPGRGTTLTARVPGVADQGPTDPPVSQPAATAPQEARR